MPFSFATRRTELPTGAREPNAFTDGRKKKLSAGQLKKSAIRNSRLVSQKFFGWIGGKGNSGRSVEMVRELRLQAAGRRCGTTMAKPWVGWKSILTSPRASGLK